MTNVSSSGLSNSHLTSLSPLENNKRTFSPPAFLLPPLSFSAHLVYRRRIRPQVNTELCSCSYSWRSSSLHVFLLGRGLSSWDPEKVDTVDRESELAVKKSHSLNVQLDH